MIVASGMKLFHSMVIWQSKGIVNIHGCFILLLLIIFILVQKAVTVPQIFNENYQLCEDDFGMPDDKQKITFPDKLWSIDTKDFVLYFSFCKTPQKQCHNQTSSCLVRKSDNRLIDLGQEFRIVDIDNYIFESVRGTKCPYSSQSYTLTLLLECSDTIKAAPRLTSVPDDNSCNFEVTMMRPDCQPKCTEIIGGSHLIDLRKFPKNLKVNFESKTYSFSLCGSSWQCGSRTVSACEILSDGNVPLAATDSQYVSYDTSKNELAVKGRYKQERVTREIEVLIKCNWHTEVSNIKYKKVPTQGRKYRFELESSYGCVKLPQNCFIISTDNLQYNLTNLHHPNGWNVANVPQGKITLNICGQLNNPLNSVCSDQYSQVCHVHGDRYINRGAIVKPLTVVDDIIKAVIVSGSTCQENMESHYSTEIEFICSKQEKGPVFKEFKNCTMFVHWETPHACPIDLYKGQKCSVNDRVGHRNLGSLFTETDKLYVLSPGKAMILSYNLCGPIHEKCNNYNNVSFCLKNGQNNDVIIGWDNRDIISHNGQLKLELSGNKCLNSDSHGKVTVNFVCNYQEPSPPSQIDVIEDGCIFNMTVFTSLACFSEKKFKDCNYNLNNRSYDLLPLSSKDENYIIKDNEGIEYILNVCGPIINGPGALCRQDTMVCLRNTTEVNIKHQYVSIGGIASPAFRNNNLIIEARMNMYCEDYGYRKSVIQFECSQIKHPPIFLSRTSCIYNFIWKTPEACPMNCVFNHPGSGAVLDLNNLEEKILKVHLKNKTIWYEFHLCKDFYTEYADGKQNMNHLTKKFTYENESTYVTLDLQRECNSDNEVNKAILEFRCNRSLPDRAEEKSFENCILNIIIWTNIVCPHEKQISIYSVDNDVRNSSSIKEVELFTAKENKCTLISQNTGKELKLIQLKSFEFYNGTHKYSFNSDGKLSCTGILCKNNVQLLPMGECPSNTIDTTNHHIKLLFSTDLVCGPKEYFQLEILLKCGNALNDTKIIMNTSCKVLIEHQFSEVCSLLQEITATSQGNVTGIVVGVIISIIALGCLFVYFFKKRQPYACIRSVKSSTNIPIYNRDCTL